MINLQVLVPMDPQLLGKMFEVLIVSTGKHYLKGEVLTESLVRVPSRPKPLPAGVVSGGEKWKERQSQNKPKTAVSKQTMCTVDLLLLFSVLVVLCAGILIQYSPRMTLLFS